MSAPVLVIQNITREKPGLLAEIMQGKGMAFDTINLDNGEKLPDAPDTYRAVVVLGGPDSANDIVPKMELQIAFVQEVFKQNIPYIGICLGLQIGVKAAGGQVVKSPVKEVGFRDELGNRYEVELTEAGKQSSLFAGLDDRFNVFQLHGETVELTSAMQLLATGKLCRNQVVQLADKAFGIQSHFEVTPTMLAEWMAYDPDLTPLLADELQKDFQEIKQQYDNVAQKLFGNFLQIAGF